MALPPFTSQLIADVGISMGDEGKGRLVYEIATELREHTKKRDAVAMVLKVNGGANSGHTAGGLKLNLLPAGVIDADVPTLAIGAGVVADPRKFLWETEPLERRGYRIFERLLIDERTMVSDLSHRLLDLAWEDYRTHVLGEPQRGSTGRGISPAYTDETSHWPIYYSDFLGSREDFARRYRIRANRAVRLIKEICLVVPAHWKNFFERLTLAETRANQTAIEAGIFPKEEFHFEKFRGKDAYSLKVDELIDTYWQAGQKLRARIGDVREAVLKAVASGKYVIGEFGQSYWLDKRHGFPPNVTASHTFTPEFFQSASIPCQPVHTVGCCKAYDTKVGTHVFLTQMEDNHPLAKLLGELEFGTSTGRQRMVGWYDAVEKGDALRYGGFQDLAINKLDALTHRGAWKGELLVCTGYQTADGSPVIGVPRNDDVRKTLRPVYAKLPGWSEDIAGVKSFAQLPANAQRYVAFMVKSVLDVATRGGVKIAPPNLRYIGTGPDPDQVIRDVPQTKELLKLAK
ncbi:MAG TPA: adenylosuccinate synthetase [Opitutales bacterium]|nr:adenylosuccinate synthetase [Opitutales bacterium]